MHLVIMAFGMYIMQIVPPSLEALMDVHIDDGMPKACMRMQSTWTAWPRDCKRSFSHIPSLS